MLYRFKSQATADVVMLETNARQLFNIIGKPVAPEGVITLEQMPTALSALETAIGQEASVSPHNHDAYAVEDHDTKAEREHVGLHQRAAPLIEMIKRSLEDGKAIVWSV